MPTDAPNNPSLPAIRFIREPELKSRTSLTSTVIDKLEQAGVFPRRVPISDRVVAWVEEEVAIWQRDRIAARDDVARSTELKLLRAPSPARRRLQDQRKRVPEPEDAGPV
jgi:prophage regulatory protein